jgi:hypothetical protein
VKPGDAATSTSTDQCSAASPTSSTSSRFADSSGSSPRWSINPAGSSQIRLPSGCRYWWISVTWPSSSSATIATAPWCSTTSRFAWPPPGIATSSTRTAMIRPT